METSQSIFVQENETLELTLASLDRLIQECSFEAGRTNLRNLYDRVGVSSYEVFVSSLPNLQAINRARIQMKNSPYFGRFDIYENGKQERYYVGSRSESLDNIRILDWKSTKSRLYYEVESEGYFDLEISEETRRIPVFQKFNINILNSKLQDVIVVFSKDPTSFDKDKNIKPAINYRDIQRKPAKQVSQKDAPSISSSINREHIKDDIKSSKITAKPIEMKIESSTNRPTSTTTKPNQFLTSELESRGDPKFHTIYRTFQAEQFRIVRLPSDRVLIVNGVAGSGKTSVGYHRLSYLSYEERTKELKSNKMLVFGPNKLFLSFISELLPSLETQGVYETTFEDWALVRLGLGYQDTNGHTIRKVVITDNTSDLFLSSTISSQEKKALWKRSRLKGSIKFGKAIKRIIENGFKPCPIQVDYRFPISEEKTNFFTITKEKLNTLWSRLPQKLSVERKFNAFSEAIKDHINSEIINNSSEDSVKLNLSNDIKSLTFNGVSRVVNDFLTLYPITIYSEIINNKQSLFSQFQGFSKSELGILGSFNFDDISIDLEDLAGVLYIKLLISPVGYAKQDHILIDEGQDFSPLHYEIFKDISQGQSLTILGDMAQGIVAHRGLHNWDELNGIFDNIQNMDLQISYRTTYEITNLANEVLHKVHNKEVVSAIPYPRPGKKPNLLVVTTEEKLFLRLAEELFTANKLNGSNTGILTKSEKDAAAVFRYLLNKGINSRLILKRDQTFNLQKGITILPINLSKGLEFEKVIMFNVSKANYDDFVQYDGRLLYVGITRALHELIMISLGEPTRFLKESRLIDVYNER